CTAGRGRRCGENTGSGTCGRPSRTISSASSRYDGAPSEPDLRLRRIGRGGILMRLQGSLGVAASAAAALLMLAAPAAAAEEEAARRLLDAAAEAMGGWDRLSRVENVVLTGFGQRLYQDGGGNVTGDVNAPPKWQAVADAERVFDLANGRALNLERRSF